MCLLGAMDLELCGLWTEENFHGLYHSPPTFSGTTVTNGKMTVPVIYLDATREAIVHIN